MISVIIPVYNEEECLSKDAVYYQAISRDADLIFVDGGSGDDTIFLAKKSGRVISAPKSRAVQMNQGAKEAKNDILLFLHADTRIHPENLQHIVEAMKNKKYVGGCFKQVLDDPAVIYRWIAWTGNMRARLSKIFFGDQGIFVRKDVFQKLGGFPEVRIGEDVLFTKKLRKQGNVGILPCPIYCSARRWKSQGIWRTFFLNWRINLALTRDQNLDSVADVYRDVREKGKRHQI